MKQCLDKLVGLSRTECECIKIDSELRESKYNLFVDELEGIDLELINNSLGCGEELEDNFEKMYETATSFFETDLQVELGLHYKQRHSPYTGRIGEQKYSGALNVTESLLGLKLSTKKITGATAVINQILLYFNNTGQINLKVYQGKDVLLKEYTGINVVNGTTTFNLPEPLVLPLTTYGHSEEYYFVYELPPGLKPMNNETKCGCHGIESVRGVFLSPSGVKGTTMYDLKTSSQAMGLSLNATIGCSIENNLCELISPELIKRKVAIALWYKMGVLTLEKLFGSREINYDTISNGEYLYTRKKKFESLYKSIVEWLGENVELTDSDCFICNTNKQMSIGKILI